MKREKNSSVQSSSTESFTKRSFRLKPEHLASHTSDSNTCNEQLAIPDDQRQGFASVAFVQKAIDNQNDRFSWPEHAIKNLITGLHQARPISGRKSTRGRRKSKMATKIPHKDNLSPLPSDDPMFDYQSPTYVSEDYSDSSGSDEGHDRDFLPPTEKPVVPEEDMANRQPERLTDIDSATKGRPVQTTYNPDLVCDDSVFHVDEDIAQYFNKYRFKALSNFQFEKVKETFSKPKIEFLDPPSVNEVIMASKSVRNNTGLLKGDSSLSKIQERLSYSTFPLLHLMRKIRSDDQLTKEEILTSFELPIVLSSSFYASLSSVRRQRLPNMRVWFIMIVKLPANSCLGIT